MLYADDVVFCLLQQLIAYQFQLQGLSWWVCCWVTGALSELNVIYSHSVVLQWFAMYTQSAPELAHMNKPSVRVSSVVLRPRMISRATGIKLPSALNMGADSPRPCRFIRRSETLLK